MLLSRSGQVISLRPVYRLLMNIGPRVGRFLLTGGWSVWGLKKGWLLSTASTGGGLDGNITTDWKTGSVWVNVLAKSIPSSLLNLSDHFWSNCWSLLSVESLPVLAGDFFTEPLSVKEPAFLCQVLLLDSSELCLFLSVFLSGVLLAYCTSFATTIRVTVAGSTSVLLDSSIMAFC